VVRAFVKKTQRTPRAEIDLRVAARKGHHTIPFEKLKARLLANPKVKTEYDALDPEFEIATELLGARLRQVSPRPNWLPAWAPASQRSPDLKVANRCRARRPSCAMPKRPAASSTCGYRRLDAESAALRSAANTVQNRRWRARKRFERPTQIRRLQVGTGHSTTLHVGQAFSWEVAAGSYADTQGVCSLASRSIRVRGTATARATA
jgi:hypothetical protein